MSETLQSGAHLDADQLSAFAEGVLPEHERTLVLRHTAECARCREIAFLAQEPVPMQAPATERTPWWKAWSQPWVLGGAGALVASALVVSVFLWSRPESALPGNMTTALNRTPGSIQEQKPEQKSEQTPAMLDAPAPAAVRSVPLPSAPPNLSAGVQQPAAEPQAMRSGAAPTPPRAAPIVSMASAPPPAPAMMAKPSVQPQAARAETEDKSMFSMAAPLPPAAPAGAGKAAPALANASAAPIENAQVQQLAVNGRSQSVLRAAKARARETVAGPMHLQMEHGTGPNDGLARLTGTVLDPSGASIPGAVVRLTQPSTTAALQAVTDAAGRFSLAPVPAGQYQAQVSAPGFAAVTQQVDLLSRDVAQADAVLPVGAMTQTVEVSADSAMVTSAEISGSRIQDGRDVLPSGLPAASRVSSGNRSVALDTAGSVFARRTGKHWKRVKPRWDGKVAKLEAGVVDEAKKAGTSLFQITTASGAVWVSADGEHWNRR